MTLTIVKTGVMGDLRYTIADLTFDDAYPSGGEAVSASDLLLTEGVYHASVEGEAGFVFTYDRSGGKVQAFFQTDPADTGGANIALIEVDDVDILDAVVVRIFAIGK